MATGYIERIKNKIESATPSWVNCHLDGDEKVHVTLDLRAYVESTQTKVDDHLLDAFDKLVDSFPLIKTLVAGLTANGSKNHEVAGDEPKPLNSEPGA